MNGDVFIYFAEHIYFLSYNLSMEAKQDPLLYG